MPRRARAQDIPEGGSFFPSTSLCAHPRRERDSPVKRVRQNLPGRTYRRVEGTGGGIVIEMKDHVLVVESPLNDERAVAGH